MERSGGQHAVMIDAIWPADRAWREIILVLSGAALIALSAQVRIPLPFTPVPLTGQTFAVLLLAAMYGSRRGPVAVLAYLSLGVLGLPVFASGATGFAAFSTATAGYLMGYVPAAFVVGLLSERGADRSPWKTAASMIVGNLIIYATGVLWLSSFVGWGSVLQAGVLPFLPGDALKIALATIALPTAWKRIGSQRPPIAR
jgi:biotin transport system substrate-specific component